MDGPKLYVVAAVLMMLFDTIWLLLNRRMYARLVMNIQKSDMTLSLTPAFLAYVLMYIGLVSLVIPAIKKSGDTSLKNVAKIAGVFGLCVYGIFNTTNLAIFADYSWTVAFIDTIWGTVLYTVLAYICVKL